MTTIRHSRTVCGNDGVLSEGSSLCPMLSDILGPFLAMPSLGAVLNRIGDRAYGWLQASMGTTLKHDTQRNLNKYSPPPPPHVIWTA